MFPFAQGFHSRPLWLVLLLLLGCADGAPEPTQPTQGELPVGVVARVGSSDIRAELVGGIAALQAVSLQEARDRAVFDALLAEGARGELADTQLEEAETRVLARALLHQLWHEAKTPAVTPAELDAARLRNWTHVDRPVGYRVVHVVARVDEKDDAAKHARAKELAIKLRDALKSVAASVPPVPMPVIDDERRFRRGKRPADPVVKTFKSAVATVDAGDIKVKVEDAHPVAIDGMVIDHDAPPGYSYVPTFAEAAAALAEGGRGALSGVVETSFGYHVMLLLEVTPAKRLTNAQLLEELTPDILRRRGAKAEGALIEQRAQSSGVQVMSNSDALMTYVRDAQDGALTELSPGAP
jgi:hypothetical protein